MKILNDKEYEDLIKLANGAKEAVLAEKKAWQEERREIYKSHEEEIKALDRQAIHDQEDHQREIDHLKADLAAEVREKVAAAEAKFQALTIENNNHKKEVEILTTAFKNLGFDVKDMKDILNKLVDGIVSKNIINLVK